MDHRDSAARNYKRKHRGFDKKRMTLEFDLYIENLSAAELGIARASMSNAAFERFCEEYNVKDWAEVVEKLECIIVELPAEFEVCGTCEGKGTHVNPSIDSNGITGEEFAEDPEFAESYFSGHYDVQCYGCRGARVVPVMNLDAMYPREFRDMVVREAEQREQDAYDMEAESEAERRMGA